MTININNLRLFARLDPTMRFEEEKNQIGLYRNLDGQNFSSEMLVQTLEQLHVKFDHNWRAVNFGEEIISSYMDFCNQKQEFKPSFWYTVNHNIR